MNFNLYTWLGLGVFLGSLIPNYFDLKGLSPVLRLVILGFGAVLFLLLEFFKYRAIGKRERAAIVAKWLQSCSALAGVGKVRSNIFVSEGDCYVIKAQWNMDADDDRNIRIPLNMGSTGETWRTMKQVFAFNEHLKENAKNYLPEQEQAKVWPDLKWICSTPIVDHGRVVAVVNIDGNTVPDTGLKAKLQDHGRFLAEVVRDLL